MEEALREKGWYIHKLKRGSDRPDLPKGVCSFQWVITGQMSIADETLTSLDEEQDAWMKELGYVYRAEADDHWQWSLVSHKEMMRLRKPSQTEDRATLLVYFYFVPSTPPERGTVATVGRSGRVDFTSTTGDSHIHDLADGERDWYDLEVECPGEEHWSLCFITRTHPEPFHNFLGDLGFQKEEMKEGVEEPSDFKEYWPGKRRFLDR